MLLALTLLAGACGRSPDEPAAAPDPEPATVGVEVFFTNDQLGDPCGEVFAVTRAVDAEEPVRGALEALLAGPTDAERADGYGSWFSDATAEMLLDLEVVDGVAHVTFADLRPVIPNASTSCGSAALLAELDQTLLAFDTIDETRYAFADQAAFYEWLQLHDPAAPPPAEHPETAPDHDPDRASDDAAGETEAAPPPTDAETDDEDDGDRPADDSDRWRATPAVDLTGWVPDGVPRDPYSDGCCAAQIVGEVSPPWPSGSFRWPADGYYAASGDWNRDDPASLDLVLGRWVPCDERPELCENLSAPAPPHVGVEVDPDRLHRVTVALEDLAVFVTHVHAPFELPGRTGAETRGVYGEPGALAALIDDVLDPVYDEHVRTPLREGASTDDILDRLAGVADDASAPFGVFPLVDFSWDPDATFVAFRGPHGYPIEFGWTLQCDEVTLRPDTRYPPEACPIGGLYDLQMRVLEMRDGQPILHLESGWPTWG